MFSRGLRFVSSKTCHLSNQSLKNGFKHTFLVRLTKSGKYVHFIQKHNIHSTAALLLPPDFEKTFSSSAEASSEEEKKPSKIVKDEGKLNEKPSRLEQLNYDVEESPTEKWRQFKKILDEDHKNLQIFIIYSELLGGFLKPIATKLVNCNLPKPYGPSEEDFKNFLEDSWGIEDSGMYIFVPREEIELDAYKIHIVAKRREVIDGTPYTISNQTSTQVLLECIQNFPWDHVVTAEYRQQVQATKAVLENSVFYFVNAMKNFVTYNERSLTLDHNMIGRFWFHQDAFIKSLMNLEDIVALDKNGMDISILPSEEEILHYLNVMRYASCRPEETILELMCNPTSEMMKARADGACSGLETSDRAIKKE